MSQTNEGSMDELLKRLNRMYGNDEKKGSSVPKSKKEQGSGEIDPELREMIERAISDGQADPVASGSTLAVEDLPDDLAGTKRDELADRAAQMFPQTDPSVTPHEDAVPEKMRQSKETVAGVPEKTFISSESDDPEDTKEDISAGQVSDEVLRERIDQAIRLSVVQAIEENLKEPVSEEPVSEEPAPEELVQEELVQEELVPEELVQEELVQEELVQEELVQEELVQEELVQEELVQEELVQEELVQEELVQEELVQEELVQKELVQKELVPEEPIPEEPRMLPPDDAEALRFAEEGILAQEQRDLEEVALRFAEEGIQAQEEQDLAEAMAEATETVQFVAPDLGDALAGDPEQFRIDILLEELARRDTDSPVSGTERSVPKQEKKNASAAQKRTTDMPSIPPEFRSGKPLTDDDIRMLLELGYEEELAGFIGYDRIDLIRREGTGVSSSDAPRRKKKSRKKTTRSVNLTEYTDRDQNYEIRARLTERRKHLYIRFGGTLFLTVFLLFYDMPGLFGFPGFGALRPDKLPGLYAMFGLQILLLSAVLSYRQLWRGFRRAAAFEADLYFVPTLLILLDATYDLLLLIFGTTGTPALFHFVTELYLLFAIGGELIMLKREELTFDTVSAEGNRYTLEHTGYNEKDGNVYHVRRTGFLSGVLARIRSEEPFRMLSILSYAVLLFSFLMAAGGFILSGVVTDAFSVFMKSMTICVPLSSCAAFTLPQFFVTREMHKRGCAIVGDVSVQEYAAEKTVVFREEDIFKAGSKIGFSAAGKQKLAEQFRLCSLLFRKIGGTLGSVLDLSQMKTPTRETVHITHVGEDGLSAVVGNSPAVMGSAFYLESHGIRVPAESAERVYLRKSDCVPLYIAFDGAVCLELEMTYQIGEETEQMIHELSVNGSHIAVNVSDPCLTTPFVWKLRRLEPDHIKLFRVTHVQTDESFRSIDGGISAKRAGDLVYPLTACRQLRLSGRILSAILGISAGVSALFMIALLISGAMSYFSAIIIAAYQMLWHIPVLVASGIQFKQEEKKNE